MSFIVSVWACCPRHRCPLHRNQLRFEPHRPTAILACAGAPGVVAHDVARAAEIHTSQLFRWPQQLCDLACFFTVLLLAYSIARPFGAAAWPRPHPYVGSDRAAAPQQYGGWNPGAAPPDPHCARVSPIEQNSVPGPEVC
jgi:hypothetical protein